MNSATLLPARSNHTASLAAGLDLAQREAEGVSRLFGFGPNDDEDESDEAYERRLNECRALHANP